ncbi:MAG TPA: hypothetical protein P5136_02605 [Methanofastidiosum sp.]|nr:hypothetical protein [Methanofastidiosum sp.]
MKEYEFTIHVVGYGDTKEEAWKDAMETYAEELMLKGPGESPEPDLIQEMDV